MKLLEKADSEIWERIERKLLETNKTIFFWSILMHYHNICEKLRKIR